MLFSYAFAFVDGFASLHANISAQVLPTFQSVCIRSVSCIEVVHDHCRHTTPFRRSLLFRFLDHHDIVLFVIECSARALAIGVVGAIESQWRRGDCPEGCSVERKRKATHARLGLG